MYKSIIILLVMLIIVGAVRNLFQCMYSSPTNPQSLIDCATSCGILRSQQSQQNQSKDEPTRVIEHFFDNGSGDWELIRSTLNDTTPITGTGSGITDMFDYSNRSIDSQFEASHIPYIPQQHAETVGACSQCR